jgi:hypothetical protein
LGSGGLVWQAHQGSFGRDYGGRFNKHNPRDARITPTTQKMRPGFRAALNSRMHQTGSDATPVTRRRTFTTALMPLRRVLRTWPLIKLRTRPPRFLMTTRRWRATHALITRSLCHRLRTLALGARVKLWAGAARFFTAVIQARAAETLRLRHAPFKTTLRPLPHHLRPTTMRFPARSALELRTKTSSATALPGKTTLGKVLRAWAA